MPSWTFHILTFGCKVNQYESQAIREAWQAQGGSEATAPEAADVVFINSCAVTGRAERDARNAVFRVRRAAPKARIILAGCAARLFEAFRPRPGAEWAEPDLCLGNNAKVALLAGPWPHSGEGPAAQQAPPVYPPFHISGFSRARAVLKVQDGCVHRCTYCIVPQTRGAPRSRPPQEALAEARALLVKGHAELVISGINLSQYGRDRPEYGDFWQLLRFLDAELAPEFAGRARLRISSLEPSQLDDRGLETLAGCRLVCPHLHISLQHASPAVLRQMGRGHYSAAGLERALAALASFWPRMGLGADILVGFPGETEKDFSILMEALARLPLSYAHVFPYSRRPGTAAAQFPGQLPLRLRQERAAAARAVVERQRQRFWEGQLRLERMLVAPDAGEGARGKGVCKGVNEYYVPCIFPAPPRADAGVGRLVEARPMGLDARGLLMEAF
ncbi:MAG: MiaB/RimO family radical SAM methylthiotransferase [Desulfovibrio sp.]|uniref:MiaB/RimO family radical SAM methylthiotransferase n=1 Tax=Desulfovibrio sp. TaxID=885 RepID=UPI001A77517D|nr:MiaB/RimO family radical SAM methylthiotransferase [Desulfovibrio sp.]MBD5417526.1 MiaB/RimO family radical SAM methylthiotransferase [Desulfovibrio sp.]